MKRVEGAGRPAHGWRLRPNVFAFTTGFGVALATSAAIVSERLSQGDPRVSLAANALVTLASVLALASMLRWRARAGAAPGMVGVLAAQAAGVALGIGAVHLALREAGPAPWLSERPAQFVNDGVAAFATLTVVWACARGLDAGVLVLALVVLTGYRATAWLWHVDHAPHAFAVSVQQLVLAQSAAAAVALGLFYGMTRLSRGDDASR